MPKIPNELRPAVVRFILPEARSDSAVARCSPLGFGWSLSDMNGHLLDAIKIGIGDNNHKFTAIGIGMWPATIIWFNGWFIIMPKKPG